MRTGDLLLIIALCMVTALCAARVLSESAECDKKNGIYIEGEWPEDSVCLPKGTYP